MVVATYAGAKESVAWGDLAARVPVLLETMQADMLAAAAQRQQASMAKVGAASGGEGGSCVGCEGSIWGL